MRCSAAWDDTDTRGWLWRVEERAAKGRRETGERGGGCRGRGCRATCDAVTSANHPPLRPPATPRLPRPIPFPCAAHEPHPRDQTRPPNYELEFELAVNPFIALPPPPAWQPPDRLTAVLFIRRPAAAPSPPPMFPAAGFSPVTHTRRSVARRRHAALCGCTMHRVA